MGRFTLSEHLLNENSGVDHLDLFLSIQDNDYLITYKLPKNKMNSFGFLQSNHRLRYIYYEGKIKNDEKIRIIKKGFFIGQRQLSSPNPPGFLKISLEQTNGKLADMWKKTDFKIAFDEIKLYEIADDKRSLWEKQIAQREQALSEQELKIKTTGTAAVEEYPEEKIPQNGIVESEVIAMINPPTKTPEEAANEPAEKKSTETKIAAETTAKSEAPVKDIDLATEERAEKADILPEKTSPTVYHEGIISTPPQPTQDFVEDKNQDFVPVQELILDDQGKAAGQYTSEK